MSDKKHECKENIHGYIIYIAFDEWRIDDVDDPYYGVYHVKYCPFCGIKLEGS